MEALLLKRSHAARFIPGAYVFPGGTVDSDDGSAALLERIAGVSPARAREILNLSDVQGPPPTAFWVAALRETFEETGILLSRRPSGEEDALSARDADERLIPKGRAETLREDLLAGRLTFPEVLDRLDVTLDAGALTYVGHWVTPDCEPWRFDTRFFAAVVPHSTSVVLHQAELAESLWLTPAEALERNSDGTLPLVFPTLRTLEKLAVFRNPVEALEDLAGRPIPRVQPTLIRTEGGIGIVAEE